MASDSDSHQIPCQRSVHNAAESTDTIVSRELSKIIPTIAGAMAQHANAFSCTFYIYNFSLTRTVTTFRYGESELLYPEWGELDSASPDEIPIEAEILRTKQSIRRSSPEDFQRFPMLNQYLRNRPDDYVDMVVPLNRRNHVFGVAYLWRHSGAKPFTDEELFAVEQLAEVAAMAVEYARFYSNERVSRLRLDALLNVASLAASHLTVDQVMPEVTRILRSVTEADVCNLYVFDHDGQEVSASFTSGLNAREQWVYDRSPKYPVADVPAEVRAGEILGPVVVTDPEREFVPDSELVTYAREAGISNILVLPIVYQRAMIGVAYLWYRDGSRKFSDEEISTAQGVADQAGGVVSQARMYDASQLYISETEALRRIGESVLKSESLNDVLDQIADVLGQMIPHDYAFFGRIDPNRDEVVIDRTWGAFPRVVVNYRLSLENSLTGRAVCSGKIVNLADADQDPQIHRSSEEYLPIRSVLIAPLVKENQCSGVLYIGQHDPSGFSPRQERLMALLSQQAAAAIERTEAREWLAAHARRQSFLANVTNQLIAAPEPTDVLQEICESGAGVLASGVAIALSTWEYGAIIWMGAAHQDPELHTIFHDAIVDDCPIVDADRLELILASERSSLIPLENGYPTDGRELHPTVTELLNRVGADQVLNVPMRQRGRAPGLLILVSSEHSAHQIDEDLMEVAQNVANRIGDALERRQMARNRESLLRVSEAINTHADLDELLDMFSSELHRIVPYEQMYLGRSDPDAQRTLPLKFVNPHGLSEPDVDLASNEGISGEVMRSRKALLDNNAHRRPTSVYGSGAEADYYSQHGESVMAAPLIADDNVVGVLFVDRTGANRFSESDFETFLLFTGLAASAIQRTELLQKNQLLYRASVEVLAAVVDAKDPTTLAHSRNVARYARMIAEEYRLTASEIERVELAGLLHDIGKLSIPDHVLSKPGPLTPQERALINTHAERGANILNQHPALVNLTPLVRHHHERIDGTGYPNGLRGDDIPLGASMISIADAFDTMTSERSYQRTKSVKGSLDELERCAGTQFHPELVQLFVRVIRRHPVPAS